MVQKILSWFFPVRWPKEPIQGHRSAEIVNFLEYRERRRQGFTLDN